MSNDRRSKGCSNENCEMHINKVMQKSFYDYCPKCGTKLIFVCAKCFKEIENIDEKHKICNLCAAEAEDKRAERIEKIKKAGTAAGKAVAGVAAPVVAGIVGKVVKDGQNGAIKRGVKIVEGVAKEILKK